MNSSMLVNMMDSKDNPLFKSGTNKRSKQITFPKAYYETGIDSEGITRVTLKANLSVVRAKENAQPNLRVTFANKYTFNQRAFKRGKIPYFAPNCRN